MFPASRHRRGKPKLFLSRIPPFQPTEVGSTGGTQTLKVTNVGKAEATRLRVIPRGAGRRDFRLGEINPKSLKPGATASFTATFEPRKGGTRQAKLLILSSAPSVQAILTGRGDEPVVDKPGGTGHLPVINY